jgi:hypothetical protein
LDAAPDAFVISAQQPLPAALFFFSSPPASATEAHASTAVIAATAASDRVIMGASPHIVKEQWTADTVG